MHIREKMAKIGKETVTVTDLGFYYTPQNQNKRISIKKELDASINGTILYTEEDTDDLLQRIQPKRTFQTEFEVKNETTLQGAKRLKEEGFDNVFCLNFASARNPGGGFLKGAIAQEESLARSSGLYPTLLEHEEMYEHNREIKTGLYSDYMIYSPNVPVFRDDNGNFLEKPYCVSFLTSPAVNAGVVKKYNDPNELSQIHSTMKTRIEKILAVALEQGYEALVLGAFGAGVFKNDPKDVANYFHDILTKNPTFTNRFKKITFSVLDMTKERGTFIPFYNTFH